MEKNHDYWRDAAGVYRDWRTGKKNLVDMVDGDLQMFDDYLHIVLVGREFRRLELETVPGSRRRVFPGRLLFLIPAAILFVLVVYPILRGIR